MTASGRSCAIDVTKEVGSEVDLPSIAFAWPERGAFESQSFTEENATRTPKQPTTTVNMLGVAGRAARRELPVWIVSFRQAILTKRRVEDVSDEVPVRFRERLTA
jgi:hypothetical protein